MPKQVIVVTNLLIDYTNTLASIFATFEKNKKKLLFNIFTGN